MGDVIPFPCASPQEQKIAYRALTEHVIGVSEAQAKWDAGTLPKGRYTVVDDELRVIPNPGYWPTNQLGVTYTDTSTGVSWAYKHGWYSGEWMFHAPDDEPDAYYGTSHGYVPQRVRDAAAPIIATYPPFKPTTYHEDYI